MSNYIEKVYLVLFSLIPVSIIIGAAASLTNILAVILVFSFFSLKNFKIGFFSSREITLLFALYIYLIFNSFIAIDFGMSAARNFGFLRFIILFIAINYFFKLSNKKGNFTHFWTIVLIIVSLDSYLEFFTGKNVLGYGEIYGDRIVSFFKDEPIVGGYINGFIFIIFGFYFDRYFEKDIRYKILLFSLLLLLFLTVLITGERSNSIKLLLGLFLFFTLNMQLNLKTKIISFIGIFVLFFLILSNSNYLKSRYYGGFVYHIIDSQRLASFIENQEYFELYRSGYAIFKDYPYFGVGNKNYRVITIRDSDFKDDYEISTHPHQIYIELISEHGAIGTVIILSIIFTLMFKNLKIIILSRNSVQLGCFVYLLINFIPLLPGGSFFSDFPSTLFWLNLSIMYACNPSTNIFKAKHIQK